MPTNPFSLRDNRGAVVLLTVYVLSLMLLVIGGVSLQRSTHEQYLSQIARDHQQAFWVAETGLDLAIQRIRQNPMNVDTAPYPNKPPSLTITIGQSLTPPTWTQPIPKFLYQVDSEVRNYGSSKVSSTLHAKVTTDATMTGLWAGEYVMMWSGFWGPEYDEHTIDYTGDVRVGGGTIQTVWVGRGTTIWGNVSIGPSKASEMSFGFPGQVYPGWQEPMMSSDLEWAGVYLEPDTDNSPPLPTGRVTGTATSKSLPIAPLPEVPEQCADPANMGSVQVAAEEVLEVRDGDPLDHSESGDGRILVCASELKVGEKARLTFKNPTMVYLAKEGIRNWGTINVAIGTLPDDRGLTILSDKHMSWTEVGRMEGSIYAPRSDLYLGRTDVDPYSEVGDYEMQPYQRILGYLVANSIDIDGVNTSARVSGAGTPHSPPQVTTWYTD